MPFATVFQTLAILGLSNISSSSMWVQ